MTLLELAPHHKTGLVLKSPVLAASGCWGFADEYAGLVDFSQLGAFVTNPITLRPRKPARAQLSAPLPGGVLLHTGLPNPGLSRVCRDYAGRWRRLPCPVILHLAVTGVGDTERCVERLEEMDSIVGVELGFRDDEDSGVAIDAIAAAAAGLLPVIVRAPFQRALEFAQLAEGAGAAALTVAAPPRGAVRDPESGAVVTGRLYGPAVFPQMLRLLGEVRGATNMPLVAAGGIHTVDQTRACLDTGATAIQLDSVVWAEPQRVGEIAAALLQQH